MQHSRIHSYGRFFHICALATFDAAQGLLDTVQAAAGEVDAGGIIDAAGRKLIAAREFYDGAASKVSEAAPVVAMVILLVQQVRRARREPDAARDARAARGRAYADAMNVETDPELARSSGLPVVDATATETKSPRARRPQPDAEYNERVKAALTRRPGK